MGLHESRHAISRARFFLDRASRCKADEREDYEAFIEASIIFARTALHRLQSQHKKQPDWKAWWNSLLGDASVSFFREERNWILKQGPPKVGQIVKLGGPPPVLAQDHYYYESPGISATATIAKHLDRLATIVRKAEARFVT